MRFARLSCVAPCCNCPVAVASQNARQGRIYCMSCLFGIAVMALDGPRDIVCQPSSKRGPTATASLRRAAQVGIGLMKHSLRLAVLGQKTSPIELCLACQLSGLGA